MKNKQTLQEKASNANTTGTAVRTKTQLMRQAGYPTLMEMSTAEGDVYAVTQYADHSAALNRVQSRTNPAQEEAGSYEDGGAVVQWTRILGEDGDQYLIETRKEA